jgi:hypothetical protein
MMLWAVLEVAWVPALLLVLLAAALLGSQPIR